MGAPALRLTARAPTRHSRGTDLGGRAADATTPHYISYSGLTAELRSRTDLFIAAHSAEWGIAAFVVLAGFSLAYTCRVARPGH